MQRVPTLDRRSRLERQRKRTSCRSVGPATSAIGTPSVAFVQRSPMQTVVQSYCYRDYVAKATLLNLGKRGIRLREQYQWLPPRS